MCQTNEGNKLTQPSVVGKLNRELIKLVISLYNNEQTETVRLHSQLHLRLCFPYKRLPPHDVSLEVLLTCSYSTHRLNKGKGAAVIALEHFDTVLSCGLMI